MSVPCCGLGIITPVLTAHNTLYWTCALLTGFLTCMPLQGALQRVRSYGLPCWLLVMAHTCRLHTLLQMKRCVRLIASQAGALPSGAALRDTGVLQGPHAQAAAVSATVGLRWVPPRRPSCHARPAAAAEGALQRCGVPGRRPPRLPCSQRSACCCGPLRRPTWG